MVKVCFLCKRTYEKASTRSYHLFPTNLTERTQWFQVLGMEVVFTRNIYLCSDHFDPTEFYIQPSGRRVLKPNAKPINIPSSSTQEDVIVVSSSSTSDKSGTYVQATTDAPVMIEQQTGSDKSLLAVPLSATSSSATISADSGEVRENVSVESGIMGPPRKRVKLMKTKLAESCSRKITPQKKRRKTPRYVGDILSDEFDIPRKAKRNWHIAKKTIEEHKKKIQTLQQHNRRLRARVVCFKSLLKHLTSSNMITENATLTLNASVPASSTDIMKRLLKGPSRQKYTPELRAFSLTLSFYSSRAYNYVRTKFNNSLPHPSTITRWYRSVDGAPGFTEEALNALKEKVHEATEKGSKVICNFVMDEIAIRKKVEWTGKKFTGYVDLGSRLDGDALPEAKEVLQFMLVAVNGHWKVPIGYFLINGLTSTEKANLVTKALEFLHDSDVIVSSMTFDGTPTNLNMATILGASFDDATHIISFFQHPLTQRKIYFYLDACHMLKLLRNCLASQGKLTDGEGGEILWVFFERLVHLQDIEGLHAANKFKKRHLHWAREKMKVNIAAQTFSNSVADAFIFLEEDIKHPDFKNVGPTAKFCKIVNNLFDIFNTRNFAAKTKFRKPLSEQNYGEILQYLNFCKQYILKLKLNNVPIINSSRKTGFLGFLICIESLISMYGDYVAGNTPLLKYILTYKFSQDHLEIFFSAVRSKGGLNNNPTAHQYEAIYKRLLLRTEIKGAESGNAVAIDNTSLLHCSSRTLTYNDNGEDLQDSAAFIELSTHLEDHTYICTTAWHLTTYVDDVVAYMAGFIVRRLKKCITCAFCSTLLTTDIVISRLQQRKQYGAMTSASPFVIKICLVAESCLRRIKCEHNIFMQKNLLPILINTTIRHLPSSIYDYFDDHSFNDNVLNNHSVELIKLILKKYFNMRIHHETKRLQDEECGSRVRSLLTKTILFKNQ